MTPTPAPSDAAASEGPSLAIVVALPLPEPNRSRKIWQPVTDTDGLALRLAPLDWQPSGAHHALEHLAAENDRLRALLAALALPGAAQMTIREVGSVEIITEPGRPTIMCKPLGSTTVCQTIGSPDPKPEDHE